MNKSLFHLFILLVFFTTSMMLAQEPSSENTLQLKTFIPQEPNIAALSKYTLTPVSEYTGIPNISVPLMNLSEGDINVPISLSYHSGGIRIPEEASNVGLGWTLNAGGMITRSVEDRDDLKFGREIMPDTPLDVNGYYDPYQYGAIQSNDDCKFPYNGVLTHFPKPSPSNHNNRQDLIPDTFNFNFNGYSGSFVLTKDKKAHFFKQTDLIINLLSEDNFEAITPDGTKYIFNDKVETSIPLWAESPYSGTVPYISSWYLSKIVTKNKQVINFIYDYREDYKPLGTFNSSYKRLFTDNSNPSNPPEHLNTYKITYSAGHSQIQTAYLTEISSNSSKLKFTYSNQGERLDIKTGYSLNKIELYNTTSNVDQFVKKVDLNYSYFGTSKQSLSWPSAGDYSGEIRADNSDSNWGLRLRLDNLIINDLETYSFDYYGNGIDLSYPSKTTMSQDHWGLYNGITNLYSFIPRLEKLVCNAPVPLQKPVYNAKRHAVENTAKVFTLKKMIYPTGGYTEYNHELHTFDNEKYKVRFSEEDKTFSSGSHENNGGWIEDTITVSIDQNTTTIVELNYNFYMYDWPGNSIPPVDPAYAEIQILGGPDGTIIEKMTQENANIQTDQNGQPIPGVPVTRSLKKEICLTEGTYTIRCHFTNNNQYAGQSKIRLKWQNTYLNSQKKYGLGGGLRVKSITDHDADGSVKLKREFNYHYKEIENGLETEKSYGILRNPPKYNDTYQTNSLDSRYSTFVHGTEIITSGSNHDVYFYNPVASTNTSLYQDQGSYVGYDQVTVSYVNPSNNKNGKETFKFYNKIKHTTAYNGNYGFYRYRFSRIIDPRNGLLKIKENYKANPDNSFTLVSSTENDYAINNIEISEFTDNDITKNLNYILGGNKIAMGYLHLIGESTNFYKVSDCLDNNSYAFQFHPYYSNLIQQTGVKETIFDTNGENPVVSESKFFYDSANHLQRTRTETTDSNGNIVSTKIYYPDDVLSTSTLGEALTPQEFNAINRLKRTGIESRIGQPIQTEMLYNNVKSIQRTNFKIWQTNITLPNFVQSSKNNRVLENRLAYYSYDNVGNPLEVSKADGTHIVYIWGYNKEYPIAKLENATYSQVTGFVNDLQTKSNADDDRTIGYAGKEGELREALDHLRNAFPQAQVTTYTYDPLIGVTSITDPRGYVMYYQYDDFNRLQYVKDAEGNILNENEYNYAPQN